MNLNKAKKKKKSKGVELSFIEVFQQINEEGIIGLQYHECATSPEWQALSKHWAAGAKQTSRTS